jgi:cholesterol transport system auxiliary component
MTAQIWRPIAALCLAGMVSGCAGLTTLTSATTPTDLFTLTPKSTFDPGLPRLEQQVVVAEPTATATVRTDRIAVQPTPLKVEFLPGARWVDPAPAIIQSLLIESYENSGKVDAVGRSAVSLRPDYLVVTDVREFQARTRADGTPNAPLQVIVRLNLKLVNAENDRIIGSRSFQRVVDTRSDAPDDVAQAFDSALGNVLRNAVEWSIRRMHSDSLNRAALEAES